MSSFLCCWNSTFGKFLGFNVAYVGHREIFEDIRRSRLQILREVLNDGLKSWHRTLVLGLEGEGDIVYTILSSAHMHLRNSQK
jgi:hypothetical protein